MPEWISVEERLPKPFLSVLVFMPAGILSLSVCEGFLSDGRLWSTRHGLLDFTSITHWMPMPLPPAEYLEQYIKGGD